MATKPTTTTRSTAKRSSITASKKPVTKPKTTTRATKTTSTTATTRQTKSVTGSAKETAASTEKPQATPHGAELNAVRKKELVDRVVARTGVKKRDAKPVVEALLAELGAALAEGRSLVLPPLGRAHVNRTKDIEDGRVITIRLRQKDVSESDITPVKTAAE